MTTLVEGKRLIPAFDEKVQIKVYIPKDLSVRLRELISQKYGKYKGGLLSFEVEDALRKHLAAHTNITQIPKGSNPLPKVHIIKEQIKQYLREKYGYMITNQVLKWQFDEALVNLRGTDPRTMEKWYRVLIAAKVLKVLGPNHVELI